MLRGAVLLHTHFTAFLVTYTLFQIPMRLKKKKKQSVSVVSVAIESDGCRFRGHATGLALAARLGIRTGYP